MPFWLFVPKSLVFVSLHETEKTVIKNLQGTSFLYIIRVSFLFFSAGTTKLSYFFPVVEAFAWDIDFTLVSDLKHLRSLTDLYRRGTCTKPKFSYKLRNQRNDT